METNTDLESNSTTHMIRDNGGPSIQEPKPSEPGQEEAIALVTNSVKTSTSMLLLPLDHTEEPTKIELDGTHREDKTSKTMERNALMSTETTTLTRDTLSITTATMVTTKPGG